MRHLNLNMSDEKSLTSEVANGVRSVFDRIGEFFHIFDLSFFVSGGMVVGALVFTYLRMGYPREFPFASWISVLATIIACYVCGLIAFAVGREFSGRTFRRRTLEKTLPSALEEHNLTDEVTSRYIAADKPRLWRLYVRMWSDIAHEKSAPLLLHHLMRYWAMSATYDSVAFSFIAWAAAFVALQFETVTYKPIGHGVGSVAASLCLAAAFFAFRRGANYYEYQIEDVVAHFAVTRHSLTQLYSPPLMR
jgi:hypothetical protein